MELGSFAGFTELSGSLAIVEERFDPSIVLYHAQRSCVVQVGDQIDRRVYDEHYPWTRFSLPAQNFSLRISLRIFPVPVLGRGSVEKSIIRGSLNLPRRCSRNALNSSLVSDSPGFRTTMAAGTSPHLSLGAATTAHSKTAGCEKMARSTSMDEIFSPPEMMISFLRSTMWR